MLQVELQNSLLPISFQPGRVQLNEHLEMLICRSLRLIKTSSARFSIVRHLMLNK